MTSQQPSPSWLPQYGGPGNGFDTSSSSTPSQEIIPTLHLGKTADQNDQTSYASNSPTASIVNQNANSVVEIAAHSPSLPANQEYVGSGFFIDNHGDIATAYHIVNGASTVQVSTADGTTLPARVIKTDPKSDLAELSIGTQYMTQPVQLEANTNTNTLPQGEKLLALGHPEGWNSLYASPGKFDNKVALSDIAAPNDLNGANPNLAMLATDMNTQQGDSGAPVFDTKGKVVGVVDRGDKGNHGYMVSVDSLHSLTNGTPDTGVITPNSDTGSVPYSPHYGRADGNTLVYTLSGAAMLGSKLFPGNVTNFLGARGQMLSGVWGATDLVLHDASSLSHALSDHSSGQTFKAGLNVGADALMIGGAVGRFIPQLRGASMALSLAGTALKVGNTIF
jgi:S1-C subfamily serine protease